MMLDARPELAADWADERDMSTLTHGSKYMAAWKCAACGYEWRASVKQRAGAQKSGCASCSGRVRVVGKSDLATTHPAIAAQLDDPLWDATQVTASSKERLRWACPVGHFWTAAPSNRARTGSGCAVCAGWQVAVGFNDMATTAPELAAQLDDPEHTARSITQNYRKKVWWKCEAGHRWQSAPATRTRQSQGCPVCVNKKVLPGFNDLSTTHPLLAAEWVDTERAPTSVTYGSSYRALWKCSAGHEWRAGVADRASLGTGCNECYGKRFVSFFEESVLGYVDSILDAGIETTVRRFRSSGVSELDIFIPSLGIAIECNGVYWHSEKFKSKNYHAEKRAACEALGIRLIQVWEDDWADRRPIVERLLAHKLGVSKEERIPARKTVACSVSTAEAREFLNANHIQGFTGATYHLGLENDGCLVAVMSLKRTGKPGELRLERYATSAHVLGGQSKLIRHAEREVSDWTHLITFADLEVSDGDLYEKSGWVKDGELPPDYKYRVGARREHKFNYRLKRFREDPALKYEEGMSERELAILNGLDRIWDSGKIRYRFE